MLRRRRSRKPNDLHALDPWVVKKRPATRPDRGHAEQVNATCSVLFSNVLGLEFDQERNAATVDREGRITRDNSRLHAYVIPTEEDLMIAHEALRWWGSTIGGVGNPAAKAK